MLNRRAQMLRNKTASSVSIGMKKTIALLQCENSLIQKAKPGEYTIKVVNTCEEREEVFKLGYQVYREKGYIDQNPNEWLIRGYDANEETVILIVQDKNKKIIGSVTLVFEENCKLPSEKMYRDEIKNIKNEGHRLAEISRLIIHPDYRNSKEVLLLLFNYLAIYTYRVKKYSCLIVQVNPRHISYYKLLLKFKEVGNQKISPIVNNAPAILLSLTTDTYKHEMENLKGNIIFHRKERSLYPHFLKSEQEKLVVQYLKNQVKPISQAEKIYFGFSESGISKAVCI